MTKKTAILLAGHGSRVCGANETLHALAGKIRRKGGFDIVEVAYCGRHQPDVQAGIDTCVRKGAERILIHPYFLFAGAHVLEELPMEAEQAALRYAGVEIVLSDPLGTHPGLDAFVCEALSDALERADWSG